MVAVVICVMTDGAYSVGVGMPGLASRAGTILVD